jgi:hypothetical protein
LQMTPRPQSLPRTSVWKTNDFVSFRLERIRRVGLGSSVSSKVPTRAQSARKRSWLPSSLRSDSTNGSGDSWIGRGYHSWTRPLGHLNRKSM